MADDINSGDIGKKNRPCKEINDQSAPFQAPFVSVHMITYNHSPYIAQAIEGVLMQVTNYPFELIIGEDCSTDGTKEIVFDYQRKYPNIIRVITSDKNVGAHENSCRVAQACQGKYISFCEGDDYWTNPNKLHKQVEFLETNPDYGLVHTNFKILYNETGKLTNSYHSKMNIPEGYIYENLLHNNFIWTMTMMGRRELILDAYREIDLPNNNWLMGDYPLCLELSRRSKIGYIKEVTSIYRILTLSAIHSPDPLKRVILGKSYNDIKFYFIKKYGCTEETKIDVNVAYYRFLVRSGFSTGDYQLAKIGRDVFLKTKTRLSWKKRWKELCVIPLCTNRHLFLFGKMIYIPFRYLELRLRDN